MLSLISEHFLGYLGQGFVFILYCSCLIWLWVKEKRTERRILFVYFPIFILVLFFLIPVAVIYRRLTDFETYFRLLWLLPVSVTIVYAATEIISQLKGKLKILPIALFLIFMCAGGRLIYMDEGYSVAENEYHIPPTVVDLCDEMELPGIQVFAAVPKDMLVYVRQYSALLCLPYGYDMVVKNGFPDTLAEMIDAEEVSAEELALEAHSREVYYIVVDENHIIEGNMSDYDFEEFSRVDGYVIYRTRRIDYSEYL